VALTFDDGPDAMTRQYLEVLSRQRVRATFFLVGENAERMPGLVSEYVRQGHEIGAHGWSHRPFPSLGFVDLKAELERSHAVLGAAGGEGRRLVRPPSGRVTASVLVRTAIAGFTTVLWSIDSDDCRTRDPRTVQQRLAPEALRSGDIVLLHELQPWTLKALPEAISRLREHGWEFATVSELAE
jgi:peptidoglycan/xylan/chitin deacetylase (PgdA/CDA1 family)